MKINIFGNIAFLFLLVACTNTDELSAEASNLRSSGDFSVSQILPYNRIARF
ncbi:MAG: hypothetical protein LBC48_01250 [Dysgonamonadaceae bacterium]|nr:hypothetical protein [Dysgonamonadaceae bacterium]